MTNRLWRRWLRPVVVLIVGIIVLLSFGGGLTGDPHPVSCSSHTACRVSDNAPPPGN